MVDSLEVDTMKDARQLLVLTSQQLDLMTLLYDQLQASENEVSDKARVEIMLELCRTFIFCTFTGTEFECGLIHFCAILGIDSENNRLRRASDFTYILAGLVYDIRVLAAEILLPSHEREEQAGDSSIREHFLHQRATYLADGTSTSHEHYDLAVGIRQAHLNERRQCRYGVVVFQSPDIVL